MNQSTCGPDLQAVIQWLVPIAPPARSEAHLDHHCLPHLFQDHFSLHDATMVQRHRPSVAWDLTLV